MVRLMWKLPEGIIKEAKRLHNKTNKEFSK